MAYKKSVGLDIADHTIEVLELERGLFGDAKVAAAGRMSLSPGIVSNGRIINAEALKATLMKLFAQAKPRAINADGICFGLPDSQIYTRVFTLPLHRPEDREALVLREALNSIPIDEDNLSYTYKILHETASGIEILLAATSIDVIKEWHDFFLEAKMRVDIFDLEPLALARGLLLKKIGATIVLDIGAATTNLFIFSSNDLVYNRCLMTAGDYLTKKISTDLKISPAEADEQKIKFGLSYPDNKIFPIIQEFLKEIADRALESINYFEERKKVKVGSFILVGGTSQMFGALEYFKNALKRPGVIGQMKFDNKIIPLLYIEAAGLALRAINDNYKNDLKISSSSAKAPSAATIKVSKNDEIYSPDDSGNGSEDNNSQLSKSLAPPVIAEEKVKSKLLFLVNILIIGVVLIGVAWQYRNYDKNQQTVKTQTNIINYDRLQSFDTKIEISTSGLENNDNRIVGRVSRIVVNSASDLVTAEASAKASLANDLKTGEKFYREPINRDKLTVDLQFPAIFEWLVYDQRSYLAAVYKEIDKINNKKISYALNGAEILSVGKTDSPDVFIFDCRISFYANQDLK